MTNQQYCKVNVGWKFVFGQNVIPAKQANVVVWHHWPIVVQTCWKPQSQFHITFDNLVSKFVAKFRSLSWTLEQGSSIFEPFTYQVPFIATCFFILTELSSWMAFDYHYQNALQIFFLIFIPLWEWEENWYSLYNENRQSIL
jgi:hypothetical protein